MGWWFGIALWKRVLAFLVLGVIFALLVPQGAPYVQFIGDLFVRAIRMLVAPIVLVTIASGITTLADPKRLGSLGGRTVGMFALTTFIAVSVGMLVAAVVQPGIGAPLGTAEAHVLGKPVTPYEQLINIIPTNIFDALAVAFSTASSGATLPVAMRVSEQNLGIGRSVFSTVLPLGASIGKDGTAMYVGLLSMFALQAFGVHLTPTVCATVLFTGALAAFGTAPVPSASLFMLAAVLSAVGVSPEQTALVVGFVLPFDRLLDMTRTVPSASANLTVATLVARWEGELDEEVYRAPDAA